MNAAAASPTRVLLVEDSAIQAELVRRLLVKAGFEVTLAGNGREALERMRPRSPHLVVADIAMPVMNGFELCRAIKSEPRFETIPVVLLTALADPSDIVRGLAAGADSYLIKPVDEQELVAKLRALAARPLPRVPDLPVMEIEFRGERYAIPQDSRRILHFLLTTYQHTVGQNRQLTQAKLDLERANITLEQNLHQLAASEGRFRSFVQLVPDIIYRLDQGGSFTFVNNAVAQLGYRPDELLGQHFGVLMTPGQAQAITRSRVLPNFAGQGTGSEKAPKLFDERRTGDRATRGLQLQLLPKQTRAVRFGIAQPPEGEAFVAEVASAGIYESVDGQRSLAGSVGVIRDITERKRAEEQIRNLNETLEERVRSRTFELDQANRQLAHTLEELKATQQKMIEAEKLTALGTLVAGVAHEINNPLMGTMNYVQYAAGRMADAKGVEVLRKAERELKRLAGIVENMMTYVQGRSEGVQLIGVKEPVETAVDLVASDFRRQAIELECSVAPTLPPVWGNPGGLQQVLLNLLLNARDAVAESAVKRIAVTAEASQGWVRVHVRDSGPGIPEGLGVRIFDPFVTTKPPGQGTGMGLSVSRSIIEGFGGTLMVDSLPGAGALFTVALRTQRAPVKDERRPEE